MRTPPIVRLAAVASLVLVTAGCVASASPAAAPGSGPAASHRPSAAGSTGAAGSAAGGSARSGTTSSSNRGGATSATVVAGSSQGNAARAAGSSGAAGSVGPGSSSGSAGASPAVSAPAPAGTTIVTFVPFGTGGAPAPGVHVTAHAVASACLAFGVAGTPSYRCFTTTSRVLDPCFAEPGATSGPVLCPTDPATGAAVSLSVSSLPTPSGPPSPRPWAIELADGQVCSMVNAAWGGLGPFACLGAAGGPLADCHSPVAGEPWWTADCQAAESASSPFSAERVVTVWR